MPVRTDQRSNETQTMVGEIVDRRGDSPILARLQGFADLNATEIAEFLGLLNDEQRVERRRDLVVDGYEYSRLSFVREGFAARYKLLRNGKRQIINIIVPGDVIGLPGSFLDHATFSVITLTKMTLQACSLDAFVAACYRCPKFGLALSWLAVREATTYAEHVVDIGRRTPVERLAHFLLEMHARLRLVGHATEIGFDLPISQEVMSDALGLSVPHLNRMLSRLRADGMISLNRHRVEFIDLKALEQLGNFQPFNMTRVPVAAAEIARRY